MAPKDKYSSSVNVNEASTDENGFPIILAPKQIPLGTRALKFAVMHLVVPVIAAAVLPIALISKKVKWEDLCKLYSLVSSADADPVDTPPDATLVAKVYQQPSSKRYVERTALEWQTKEGYCARTTLRCILKSFDTYPTHLLPPITRKGSNPEQWCLSIQELVQENHNNDIPCIHTKIVRGDASYESFLEAIRKVNDERCRVAINFLRPALFGFHQPRWIPVHFLFGLFTGHFSPVLGILESERPHPLVAVFDVNHRYGTYLVPAPRLYQSVKAMDITTHQSRAVIVVSQ